MRKFLLLLSILFLAITSFAQLEVKPDSFKKVDGFVNINPDIQSDDNDILYAVIKVGHYTQMDYIKIYGL